MKCRWPEEERMTTREERIASTQNTGLFLNVLIAAEIARKTLQPWLGR